ncbi:unnamed protein product [Caenorhabditis nigoni]
MSVSEEKKFVMKHVFENAANMELDKKYYGPEEEHFGVPWRIYIMKGITYHYFYLEILKSQGATPWKIDANVYSKILRPSGSGFPNFATLFYSQTGLKGHVNNFENDYLKTYLIDGKLTIELEVKIKKMSGIEPPKIRKFDDDVAKKFSDVVVMVGNQKFYVYKNYLSLHSTYFESFFSGYFAELKESIIEWKDFFWNLFFVSEPEKLTIQLKDIDPKDFQNFLELIHGDSVLEDSTVVGILKLADFFDAKSAIGRCENFLLEYSKRSMKGKFRLAIQYKLEKLEEKCVSELENADILSVRREDPLFFKSLFDESLLEIVSILLNE